MMAANFPSNVDVCIYFSKGQIHDETRDLGYCEYISEK